MKLFLYYDEDLIYSLIAQLIGNDVNLDFVAYIYENRTEEDVRYAVEPGKRKEECNFSGHISNSYFNEHRKQFIFTNIEEVKQIRKNEFIYRMLDIIEEYIVDIRKNNRCFKFYHTDFEDRNEEVKYLFNNEKYSLKDYEINEKNNDKIIFGIKINENVVKPICSYIKI